ncbi:MAG: lytic transglycosylase domain-containing protein [Pelagimonas sp.]|uniref:lytic transglycosylase domain-containing protein n=1 Tax=Pelagimonas sp. TaxID=2073170 RepID=UPI003D6AB235
MVIRFFSVALIATALFMPIQAQAQADSGGRSAKWLKPPKPGDRRSIVQVAPRANPAVPPLPNSKADVAAPATPNAPDVKDSGKPSSRYSWFWDQVSPSLGTTGAGRLEPALASLTKGPQGQSVASPRLQSLQEIAERHGRDILMQTIGTQVSPALALAVISVESSGQADAVSGAGAQGLMQLMPDTAKRFGVTDSLDAVQNIKGGVKFLDFLMTKFDGDPILVLAGYNAGENSIGKHDGVPPFSETRDYVPKVLAAFKVASGLCLTPPQLASDGCVFRISK